MAAPAFILRTLKNIFEVRDLTFRGIVRPERFRRRFRLATGLVRDIPKGKLTPGTLKDLQDEVLEALKESPFIRPTREEAEAKAQEALKDAEETAGDLLDLKPEDIKSLGDVFDDLRRRLGL